jgi:Uma2 family endonuclease
LHSTTDDGIVVCMGRKETAMAAAPKLMTVDDYFKTPETVTPMELVYGVMRVADAPTPRHQSAVLALCLALDRHVRARQLGRVWLSPLDVVLSGRDSLIVQPDLCFISNERAWIVADRVRGAPDIVVEVLSPNPRIGSTEERVGWFATYGVRECWLVHQNQRQITVVSFEDRRIRERGCHAERDPIQSKVLPEFRVSLKDILDDGL